MQKHDFHEYNNCKLLGTITKTGQVRDSDGNELSIHPTSISFHEGKIISDLVRTSQAKRSIEIGFAWGVSALWICSTLKEMGGGIHTVIDPFQSTAWKNVGISNIERAGLNNYFRFFEQPSYLTLPAFVGKEKFDFAFIDGSHLFDYVLVDFFFVDKLLEVGKLVVMHDIGYAAIQQVFAFVSKNLSYQRENTKAHNLVVMRKQDDSKRKYNFHIRF